MRCVSNIKKFADAPVAPVPRFATECDCSDVWRR